MERDTKPKLAVFRSDSGITMAFGEKSYFVDKSEPFHNIAMKALNHDDYVPFYVEIARREGKGPEFADSLAREVSLYFSENPPTE